MIPTKELVYEEFVRASGVQLTGEHARLVELERAYREQVISAMQASGLECLDGLAELAAPLARGVGSYPEHHDGHPCEVGQLALARTVARALGNPPPAGQ